MPLVILIAICNVVTKKMGVFSQKRIGQYSRLFTFYKLRTLKEEEHRLGYLELSGTSIGKYLRPIKLVEVNQRFNVLFGNMSFVSPRQYCEGFIDELAGKEGMVLKVKSEVMACYFNIQE